MSYVIKKAKELSAENKFLYIIGKARDAYVSVYIRLKFWIAYMILQIAAGKMPSL